MAFWQWISFALAEAKEAKQVPLILSVDETCISWVTGLRGKARCAADESTLAQRRSNFTLLACISADADIQTLLPQFVLVNKRQLTARDLPAVKALQPSGTHIVQGKSAWCNHGVMRHFWSALAAILKPVAKDRYIILLLDCAGCHIHDSIRSHAERLQIRLIYVPAGTTRYLQPCDLKLFSALKHTLREVWRERKGASVVGALTMQFRMAVLFESLKRMSRRDWTSAFEMAGALGRQTEVNRPLLRVLGWEQTPEVPLMPPSLENASSIFPRRRRLNIVDYVYWRKDGRPLPAEVRRRIPRLE